VLPEPFPEEKRPVCKVEILDPANSFSSFSIGFQQRSNHLLSMIMVETTILLVHANVFIRFRLSGSQ